MERLPESAEALATIGELMGQQPSMELLVVGHTDNTGAFDYNVSLTAPSRCTAHGLWWGGCRANTVSKGTACRPQVPA